jgi:predicted dehydrogenase
VLRLAVVGAGVMGTNHARVARQVRDAVVTHIVDSDSERAGKLAQAVGATAAADIADVIDEIDAAVVAAPTPLHVDIATTLLRAGIHVLVEKPIAETVEQAQDLVDEAARAEVALHVGHVERFNPAVLELDNLVDGLIHIDIARVSPYSPRIRDGVVIDLMTHDLDLACALAGADVIDVAASLQSTRSDSEDLANVLLTFANGVTASLLASRIGQNKIRRVELTQRANFVSVDLLRQDVTVHRVDHSEYLSEEGARYRQTGVVEVPFLEHRGEPLYIELAHFVDSVTNGSPARVPGEAGVRALELARRVYAAAGG